MGFSCQMQAQDWKVQSVYSAGGIWTVLPVSPAYCHCNTAEQWELGGALTWVSFDQGLCLVFKNKQNKIILNLILLTWSSYSKEGSRSQGERRRGGEQIESHRGVFLKAVCKSTFFVITRTNPTFEVFPSCYKEKVFCLIHLALNTWPDQSCWLDYTAFMLILNWPGQGRVPGSASLVGEFQE